MTSLKVHFFVVNIYGNNEFGQILFGQLFTFCHAVLKYVQCKCFKVKLSFQNLLVVVHKVNLKNIIFFFF